MKTQVMQLIVALFIKYVNLTVMIDKKGEPISRCRLELLAG
jgi:hypothetical protein